MNWESLIGPGVALGLASVAGYGGYIRLTTRFEGQARESDRRFTDGESDRKDLRLRLESLDRDAVRKNDMAAVKGEIIDRIKDFERTLRSDQAEMRDLFKKLFERTLGARP